MAAAVLKHTPGPWTVVEYGDDSPGALVVHSDRDNRVCFMATPGRTGDFDRIAANARLIAAAPKLLEAAQGLGAMPEGYCFCSQDRVGDDSKVHEPECRDLRAAIVKAGG